MALNPIVYEKFKNAFEQKCFQLIIEAYQSSLTEKIIKLDWNENDISSEIYKHIKANPLRFKSPKVSTNLEHYIPNDIPKVKGFAAKFPRIDLRLTTFFNSNEPEYFFEAKKLKQNDSALKRRYIDTGIDSFVSSKYSNGSLVGYLLKGNVEGTVNGINLLLRKANRHSETLQVKSDKITNDLYISNHSTIGVLKHIILDFISFSS